MNTKTTRTARPALMEEVPRPRPEGTRQTSPAEVLAILKPTREEPPAILIGGLWKTGLVPEGAIS